VATVTFQPLARPPASVAQVVSVATKVATAKLVTVAILQVVDVKIRLSVLLVLPMSNVVAIPIARLIMPVLCSFLKVKHVINQAIAPPTTVWMVFAVILSATHKIVVAAMVNTLSVTHAILWAKKAFAPKLKMTVPQMEPVRVLLPHFLTSAKAIRANLPAILLSAVEIIYAPMVSAAPTVRLIAIVLLALLV
jgi:hypothetical protein